MAHSLFDHHHFKKLFRHERIATLLSEEAELEAMLRFEGALATVEAALGIIPTAAASAIEAAIKHFHPDLDDLAQGARRDGLIVPTLIKRLRATIGETHGRYLHHGATSQDVIDTGLILRLRDILVILRADLERVITLLDHLEDRSGQVEIMGRTRMQRALPIPFGHRVASWRAPLRRHLQHLSPLEATLLHLQFGGPVGTLDNLGDRGAEVRAALSRELKLADPGRAWHAERDRLTDLANWLTQLSGSLGKIGLDLTLMTQNEIGEAKLATAGSSSAMPHKQNPVEAELLVTLARFNAGQQGILAQTALHDGERSGTAWTLEWMILPSMIGATAATLTIAGRALDGIDIKDRGTHRSSIG